MQDVHISDCAFTSVCAGIRIGLKSIAEIPGVVISNCTMRNVWREGIKLECTEGTMARLRFVGTTAVDDEEMTHAQRRFDNDIMGEPQFGGCRFDSNAAQPMQDVTIRDFSYTAIGGVRLADLPAAPGSENYYPNWSRTPLLGARHMWGLTPENLHFITLHSDEGPKMLTEGPTVML